MYISGYHLVLHFGVPGIWGSGGSLGVWVARGPGSGVPGLQRSRNATAKRNGDQVADKWPTSPIL